MIATENHARIQTRFNAVLNDVFILVSHNNTVHTVWLLSVTVMTGVMLGKPACYQALPNSSSHMPLASFTGLAVPPGVRSPPTADVARSNTRSSSAVSSPLYMGFWFVRTESGFESPSRAILSGADHGDRIQYDFLTDPFRWMKSLK